MVTLELARLRGFRGTLATSLIGAMREVAASARDEAMARARGDAEQRIACLRGLIAPDARTRRASAAPILESEIASIRSWRDTEIALVTTEADRRIAEQRQRLSEELAARVEQARSAEAAVWRRIDAHGIELDRVLGGIKAAEDPLAIVELAGSLHEPPSFMVPGTPPIAGR